MAMLGTLASGIGHDLRNLVMPILLRLDVLTASPDIPERSRAELASIRDIVTHLQRLAGGLRLLSSDPYQQRNEAQFTQLTEWWREVHAIVVDALRPNTKLTAEFADTLPAVAIPPDVLAQVVVNVVMNARRALEDTKNPTLEIRARMNELCVFIDIRDNGRGMDEETRRRCFEPYFTTRVREFATGLGLSTGRALVKRYGGDLTLAADTQQGATFTVHVPILRAAAAAGGSIKRRVLIDVQDPRLRALLRLIVTNRGFEDVSSGQSSNRVRDSSLESQSVEFAICDSASLPRFLEHSDDAAHQIIAIGVPQKNVGRQGVLWVDAQDLSRLTDLLE